MEGEAWPGDEIQPKIASMICLQARPVQCGCPSDMFEDEGDIFDGPFSKDFQKLSYSSDNQAVTL